VNRVMIVGGNAAAIAGVTLCLVAGMVRLLGMYTVGNVGAEALFLGGVGAMVFACLVKLQVMGKQTGA
jgi:hypothetical protein